MVSNCPNCGRNMPDDSVYCPYCGYGVKPSARTNRVSAAGTLLLVAAVTSFVFWVLSLRALAQIYSWYPSEVAGGWLFYDQVLTVFSFTGFLFGLLSGFLSLARRSYRATMLFAFLCTVSGAGAWTTSMIIPYAKAWYSFLYYFLPDFATALIGTVLIYPRKAEFKQ